MAYWYISFATDEGFRGATVVRAVDPDGALFEATRRSLNPGGEAAIIQVPYEILGNSDVAPLVDRLVGKDEMMAMGAKRHGDLPADVQGRVESAAEKVCEICNSLE